MTASNQWATRPADQRFETLAELGAAVGARRMRSRGVDVDLPRIEVRAEGGGLVVNSAISPSVPSHWSFGQLAGLLGAPASYLRKLPMQLAADCLNDGVRRMPRESVKFMTVAADDGLGTLQAVTSPTYGRIWDADCVAAVGRIVERSGGRFFNPKAYDLRSGQIRPSGLYASDRDVFMFMIDGGSRLEVGPRAKLNRGFFVQNSEVGSKTFTLTTFLFNEVCGNHIVWGAQNINQLVIRHTKGGPMRFDGEAMPTLMQYVQSSAAPEETAIRKAQEYLLPADAKGIDAEALEKLVAPFKFTRSELREAIDVARREEGECRTLWNLVQGLTAYARGFEFLDARTELEGRAGKLLRLVSE